MVSRAFILALAIGMIGACAQPLRAGFTSYYDDDDWYQDWDDDWSNSSWYDSWYEDDRSSYTSYRDSSSRDHYISWSYTDYFDEVWGTSGNKGKNGSLISYTEYRKNSRRSSDEDWWDDDKDKKEKKKDHDKDWDRERKKDWDKDYWSWYKKHKRKYKDRDKHDDCDDWYDGCKDDWHHDCDPPSHHPEPTSLAMLLGAGSTVVFGRYLRRRFKKAR